MKSRSRKGHSFGAVAAGLVVLALGAVGVGVWGYLEYLRYERVAARHLPADTQAAARLDVEEGIVYDPIRTHLVPVLFEAMRSEPDDALARRFEEQTGFKRRDLREVVVARGPAWTDWVLVLSGLFPDEGAPNKIHAFLEAEGTRGLVLESTSLAAPYLVHRPTGVAIGQADDGAVVIAASTARLAAALPSQDTAERIGLDAEAPGAFSVSVETLRELASHPAALLAPGLSELSRVSRIRGLLLLGEQLELRALFDPAPGAEPEQIHAGLSKILTGVRFLARLGAARDFAGERTLLERAQIEPLTHDNVVISATWRREEADRGAQSLARALRAWLGLPEPDA